VGGSRNSRVCGDNSVALSSIVVRIETGTDSEKKKIGFLDHLLDEPILLK